MAPVTIGEGAYVAAGSTITKDVEAEALALGRSRQVTKAWHGAERYARASQQTQERGRLKMCGIIDIAGTARRPRR